MISVLFYDILYDIIYDIKRSFSQRTYQPYIHLAAQGLRDGDAVGLACAARLLLPVRLVRSTLPALCPL
jgi:hypothetical protein